MQIEIAHEMRFRYSTPVFCEPLTIRLRPRADGAQRLLDFELSIHPQPAARTDLLDAEGNAAVQAWFGGTMSELTIRTRARVDTCRSDPFDFLLPVETLPLDRCFSDEEATALAAYSRRESDDLKVAAFAEHTLQTAGGRVIPFLMGLAAEVRDRCALEVRPDGPPWPAEQTLSEGRGACRDLTVLFNESCRAAGLPARFVSGYQADAPEGTRPELHAWSEIYLPGGGWRGFDPSQGLAVADRHVAVASGRTWRGAAPTRGTFRGTEARTELMTFVELRQETTANQGG